MKITEEQLRNIISTTIKESMALNESNDLSTIRDAMEGCYNLIIALQTKGRRFGQANDTKYMELREELLGNLEASFNSSKQMLSYLISAYKDSDEDIAYQANVGAKYLDKNFTPTW